MTQDEQTYSRWYLDYGQHSLDPMGTKEWVRTCRVCRGNKDYICVECGEIDVQSCMDNLHSNSIDDGNIYVLLNQLPKGDSGICKTT